MSRDNFTKQTIDILGKRVSAPARLYRVVILKHHTKGFVR